MDNPTSRKLPAFQFYPGDWLKDSALRRCSPAAKGTLMDLLCFMFDAETRGVLNWSEEEICHAIGHAPVTLLSLRELCDKGVIKRNSEGHYYSARMVRDERIRAEDRERQSKSRLSRSSHAPVTPESHHSSSSTSTSSSKHKIQGACGSVVVEKEEIVFPPTLNTPAFKAAWGVYEKYRASRKLAKLKPISANMKLRDIAGWGEEHAILAIEQTIGNGWNAIFQLKNSPGAKREKKISERTYTEETFN